MLARARTGGSGHTRLTSCYCIRFLDGCACGVLDKKSDDMLLFSVFAQGDGYAVAATLVYLN